VRLLIISLDAAFEEDASFLLSLPNLGALADRGVFCQRVQTIYPSLTYPVHTSLLTGCYPDKHGIGHNEKYAPNLPANKRPWHWDAQEIQAETLHQAAWRAGREVASILWPVSGHNPAVHYNFPEVHALPGENQTAKVLRYGSFWWLLQSELKYGRTREGINQPHLDRFAALLAQKLIEKQYNPHPPKEKAHSVAPSLRQQRMHMPDVLTLHLTDLDVVRHQQGTHTEETRAALVRLDQHVGHLMRALEEVGVLEDTVVAVVSDHGHADVSRVVALDSWLRAQGLPARAQTLGCGAYIRCERGDYHAVTEALLQHQEELRISQVYTRRQLRQMHAPTDIQLAVEAQEGVEFVDDLEAPPHRATHGFGPEHPASQCLLWMAGPPFLRGARLRAAHVVDIAPTLAHAVRLELPQAQGRILYEAFQSEVEGKPWPSKPL